MGTIDKGDLGGRQQMLLHIIWDLGGTAITSQITEKLEEDYGKKMTAQAVNTILLQLIDKGLVKREKKIHQSFIYETTISQQEYRKREVERIKNRTFDGSNAKMFASMVESGITEEELKKIRSILRK